MTGIIPGQPNGANEVMNAMGSLFNDTAQNLFNADYLGFDSRLANSGTPNLKNVDYDTFTSDSMTITGNIEYDATNDWYWGPNDMDSSEFDTSFDEFSNSVVDLSKWSISSGGTETGTGSITEDSTFQIIQCDSNPGTDTGIGSAFAISESIDLFLNKDFVTIDFGDIVTTLNIGTISAKLKIDATTIFDITTAGTFSNYKAQFMFFRGNGIIYYRFNNGSVWSTWTIHAGTSASEVSFNVSGSHTGLSDRFGRVNMKVDNVRFNNLATSLASTTDFITSSGSIISSTITNAIPIVNSTNFDGSGSTPVKLAADGSTFEDSTNTEIHRVSVTGINSKTRILNQGANLITEYATKHNYY